MGSRFQRDSRALRTVGCYVHHVVCIGVVNVGVNTPDSIQTENIRANPSFSANRGKETICKLHLVLPQKHVGNALLDNVLPSAVRTHQFSANHVQLQERVMDLMQHLVRQLGGDLLRDLVADLRLTERCRSHIRRSRPEGVPVDLLQHIQNEVLVEIVLALLETVLVHHNLQSTARRNTTLRGKLEIWLSAGDCVLCSRIEETHFSRISSKTQERTLTQHIRKLCERSLICVEDGELPIRAGRRRGDFG